MDLRCSFCGRSDKETRALIAGSNAFICDICVRLAMDIAGTPFKARKIEEITDAEVDAAANVYLAPRTAGDPGTTWMELKTKDIIAHEEIGYLVTRMLHEAELARQNQEEDSK